MTTNDPKLLQRVAETYFSNGTRAYLIELNKRRVREPKQENPDGKE